MAMSRPAQPPPPPPPPATRLDLEITIISGKHLKNVNWRNGDLKPYVIFWVDPDHKLTTKSDDSGNTKPVWNQRFLLPITSPLSDAFLFLEIFHSKASETPKPFVGSLQIRLSSLLEPDNPNRIRTHDLLRPSGRPQGKIRLKLAVKEQPLPQLPSLGSSSDYQNAPLGGYYYSSAPPYPYTSRSASPSPAYPYPVGYYSGYYPPPPPPSNVARSFSDRNMAYGAPSAPVDYTQYEQKSRPGSGLGVGPGLAVGAVAGALGGLALDEALKYEEDKIAERVEDNFMGSKDGFSGYCGDY